MNREYIFRGKRIDNGEWVEGYYVKLNKKAFIARIKKLQNDEEVLIYVEVIAETVGQDTGLHDKNGKRIFEGNVVMCIDEVNDITMTAIVEFGNPNHEYSWGFQLKRIHGDKANPDILLWIETEIEGVYAKVIGNIHDNPELLYKLPEMKRGK